MMQRDQIPAKCAGDGKPAYNIVAVKWHNEWPQLVRMCDECVVRTAAQVE